MCIVKLDHYIISRWKNAPESCPVQSPVPKSGIYLTFQHQFCEHPSFIRWIISSRLVRHFCIIRPSRSSVSISPSFHRANLIDKHSWWSFAFEPCLGFWSANAKKTMIAVTALWFMSDLLFQSLLCLATWSIKSRPIFPYGTRKVFFRQVVTSLYALVIAIVFSLISAPSLLRPQ